MKINLKKGKIITLFLFPFFSAYAQPSNNECSSAITIVAGATNLSGTVRNATASPGIPVDCATGNPDDDVWYKFVAVYTYANITLSNVGSSLANSGPRIQLFSASGACSGFSSLACGTIAINTTGLTIGNTYYIRIYSAGTGQSGFTVSGSTFYISVTPSSSVIVGSGRMKEVYLQTILSSSQIIADPWEITYGPDDMLWVTEAKGYKVYRMDPSTGARTTVLDISQGASGYLSGAEHTVFNVQFASNFTPWPQGGFAGLALHPQFLASSNPKNFVYISYVKRWDSTKAGNNGTFFTNYLVRFTYNNGTGKLESPVALCDTLPGSNDHNSQRLIIAPEAGTDYLFYAQGDMGAGQFSNQYRVNKSQNSASYEGKILRFNLEADADVGLLDKWIPNDNPFNGAKQSAVWSTGMRNNQGFAYDPETGLIYGSSHGPYTDDEINIIQGDKNYGHPLVIGYAADNNYNNSSAGTGNTTSSCPLITNESGTAAGLLNYKDPLYSAYAVPAGNTSTPGTVRYIWTNNPGNGGWPSEAWSGLDIYKNSIMPGWKNSLIAASLKWGRLVRLKLGTGGTSVVPTGGQDTISYFGSTNRFRDLAFAPNGKDMFVIMDRSTTTSGPSAANPVVPACGGCVQKYTFLGYADAGGKSSIPTSIDVTDGTANTCNTGTTITIDDTNNNLWVPITGLDGNIMAEIYANGYNLGTVTSSFYKHSGSIRVKNGSHYLDRNITITPQTQPGPGGVKIRLYFSKAEFDLLDADPLSGITAISDIKILKNSDACGAAASGATTLINPTYVEAHGANGYMIQGDISGFSTFYFGSTNIALPVELIDFSGSVVDLSSIVVKWKSENESNLSHFIVEKSKDGFSFSNIGSVQATGNNSSSMAYSFLDNGALTEQSAIVYYRLKMIDFDGTFTYSSIISFKSSVSAGIITVSPNPVIDNARVSIMPSVSGIIKCKLFDNTGRVIMEKKLQVVKGVESIILINMETVSSGIYIIKIEGEGLQSQLKIHKQ